jgi:hypothetical protein
MTSTPDTDLFENHNSFTQKSSYLRVQNFKKMLFTDLKSIQKWASGLYKGNLFIVNISWLTSILGKPTIRTKIKSNDQACKLFSFMPG